MKKSFIIILALLMNISSNAQDYFYYLDGKKVPFSLSNSTMCLKIDPSSNVQSIISSLEEFGKISSSMGKTIGFVYIDSIYESKYEELVSFCKEQTSIITYSPMIDNGDIRSSVGFIGEVIVLLKSSVTKDDLEKVLEQFDYTIAREDLFKDGQYIIQSNTKDGFSAITIANSLYETGLFEFAEPNFLYRDMRNTLDPYYSQQWALKNTGQSGGTSTIDINVEPAWNFTEGSSSVIVAVLDDGVKLNHPDLASNLIQGYDCTGDNTGGAPYDNNDDHGTPCAGIIGAIKDNNIGISGIAPACKIMPIRTMVDGSATSENSANGIRYAYQNGADILSRSSSFDNGDNEPTNIKNAINEALVQGRNMKGCVIVNASGNDYESTINAPANHQGVIAVGAINRSGVRAPYSNYGLGLSVVAPGVNVITTDVYGDTRYFGGTSAACPHVAGVAALILSYRPNLMGYEVKQAIERTARKIGQSDSTYVYINYPLTNSPTFGNYFPNGSWNTEVGYGLVDAYAALSYVDLLYPTADLYVRDNGTDNGNEPNLIEGNGYYNSPDIYLTDPNRQFPIFLDEIINPEPGQTYKVHVRVKNKSNMPSEENKKLYLRWTIAGTPLMWKSSWFDNGSICGQAKSGAIATLLIPSIPANGTRIVSTEWTVPSFEGTQTCINVPGATWRLSIAAVLEDGHQTSGIDATALDMNLFTASNNNVAWRNYTVLSTETPVAVTTLKNPFNTNRSFDLKFSPIDESTEIMLNEYVNVYMVLSEELMQAWNEGGNQGEDIEILEGNRIKLNSLKARLNNVMMGSNSDLLYAIEIEYKGFYDTETPLELKLSQIYHEIDQVDSVLSGLTYYIYLNEKFDIKVEAKENARALAGDNVQFTAESDELDAVFTWYNMSGDSIGNGNVLNVQAEQTQRYYLRGYSSTVDAYGYDSVSLVVRSGAITSLSPNPATNQVVVSYSITNQVQSGTVQIANTNGIVLSSTPFTAPQTSTTLNLQNLVAGQYSVRLVSATGEVLDSKTLIVH